MATYPVQIKRTSTETWMAVYTDNREHAGLGHDRYIGVVFSNDGKHRAKAKGVDLGVFPTYVEAAQALEDHHVR